MKIVALTFMSLALLACQSEVVEDSTPNCNNDLGTDWGKNYGHEVESQYNLDSDRCVEVGSVWCCAL